MYNAEVVKSIFSHWVVFADSSPAMVTLIKLLIGGRLLSTLGTLQYDWSLLGFSNDTMCLASWNDISNH